nr:protein quaking isoform X2 [Camelus dromedarius]
MSGVSAAAAAEAAAADQPRETPRPGGRGGRRRRLSGRDQPSERRRPGSSSVRSERPAPALDPRRPASRLPASEDRRSGGRGAAEGERVGRGGTCRRGGRARRAARSAAPAPLAERSVAGRRVPSGRGRGSPPLPPLGRARRARAAGRGSELAEPGIWSGMETKEEPKPTPDYLMHLMNDKKLMSSLPNFCGIFNHLERSLGEEISRVRKDMYNDTLNGSTEKRSAELPDAVGPIVQLQEKLYVPVKEYPDFNFVGRILGPRGLTAKQLEAETGCKIMVRGKGSMRDKKKEEQNRGKPNWEHLNEDLHVLITVEDAQNRAEIKLKRAVEEVKKLLVPAAEGEDSLKKMQLMELAILNGTYRDANIKSPALAFSLAATAQAAPRIITGPAPVLPPAALRTPTPAGPTIMPLIRQIQTAVMPNGTPHPTAAIVPPGPEAGLIYTPYEYPYTLAPATSILEYPIEPSGVLEWIEMPVMPDISAH